jgi:ATP-binding cassette, subfamily B, bacterial PglK
MVKHLSRFLYILGDRRKALVFMMVLFLLSSLLESLGIGLVGPFIALAMDPTSLLTMPWIAKIYHYLGFQSEIQFVTAFGFALVVLTCFKTAVIIGIQRQVFNFSYGQQVILRQKLMKAYMNRPYTFHLSRNTAELIQNIVQESTKFSTQFLVPLLTLVSDLTITVALIILLATTNLIATTSITGLLLLTFLFLLQFKGKISSWGKEVSEAETEMIRAINHGLGGLKEVRVIGCESYFEEKLFLQTHRFRQVFTKLSLFAVLPRYILEAFFITFLVVFTILSLSLGDKTDNLISTLTIFGFAAFRLLPVSSRLIGSYNLMKSADHVVDKLYFDISELENEDSALEKYHSVGNGFSITEKLNNSAIDFNHEIKLDAISYTYPGGSTLSLRQVSLTIVKGESIGIIGKSGAGKTTLVDIILGLLTPQNGAILVDGFSVSNRLREWQRLIGYIPQSIFLTDDTIERNIAFGIPDERIDPFRLRHAIDSAQMKEFIDQLPDGVKTVVGEHGVRLSGGQRQRIGIARSLYHNREVLILDEATAALDNETESLVSTAINSLKDTKTMIIIAHRLSTLSQCDRVCELENGRIVRIGKYNDIVLKKTFLA